MIVSETAPLQAIELPPLTPIILAVLVLIAVVVAFRRLRR